MNLYILIYLLCMNLIAFFLYGIDKNKAKRNVWRIKEDTLIALALLGGGIGAFTGMKVFHHKTKHLKFTILVPLSIILWGIILFFLIRQKEIIL